MHDTIKRDDLILSVFWYRAYLFSYFERSSNDWMCGDILHTKVIFLDIDGVLNSRAYLARAADGDAGIYRHLNPKKIALLKWIVEQSDADIVLSSSWKELFFRMAPLEPAAKDLLEVLHHYGMTIADMTPKIGDDRPQEIRQWLSMNPEAVSYVILDDRRYEWGELLPRWVQTSPRSGLTRRTAQMAVSLLGSTRTE